MALPKLFNPQAPGPGVSKNAPKKNRFFLFWELYFRKFWKLILANLLYVLFSLPLVTVGLAEAGLTYITRNYVREKHAFVWGDFIGTIKKNWKQALPIGFLNAFLEICLIVDVFFYSSVDIESKVTRFVMTAVAMLLLVIFTFMRYYIPLMIVTFKLSWKQLYKNAFIFAFAAIGPNVVITLGTGVFYFFAGTTVSGFVTRLLDDAGPFLTEEEITAYFSAFAIFLLIYLLFFPAFRAFLIQFCIFPKVQKHMIDPYYKEHPDEDHEKKQALNIPDEQAAEKAAEEAVFVDRGRTDSYVTPSANLTDEERAKLPPVPKQYTEREMRRFRDSQRRARGDDPDDDGTI